MGATRHGDRIAGWVAGAIAKSCMGQDFGYDVRFDAGRLAGNGPAAGKLSINYTVIVTLRHPLFGQPPFAGSFTIPVEHLENEQLVTSTAAQAVLQLGKLHKDTLDAIKNGGPAKLQVPPQSQITGN